MISNLDLVGVFVNVSRDDFVVRLFSFSDDVEGIANLHAHFFILRRVIDLVFADELLIARAVFLVKPNRAGRQRHAKLVLLRVPKSHEHADLFLNRLAGIVVARVVVSLSVQHELFLHIEAGGFEQRNLLRLVVANRRR